MADNAKLALCDRSDRRPFPNVRYHAVRPAPPLRSVWIMARPLSAILIAACCTVWLAGPGCGQSVTPANPLSPSGGDPGSNPDIHTSVNTLSDPGSPPADPPTPPSDHEDSSIADPPAPPDQP